MQSPEALLRKLLKDQLPDGCATVRILDREVDLMAEVRLDRDHLVEDDLYDHVERVAAWGRAVAKLQAKVAAASDALDELTSQTGIAYWQQLEAQEREEMREHLSDESELRDDAFRPGRRAKREALRVARGVATARWSRNFSDALVKWHVDSDDRVVAAKKLLRSLRSQLYQAQQVMVALNQRMSCLNHLAAHHRDTSRQ